MKQNTKQTIVLYNNFDISYPKFVWQIHILDKKYQDFCRGHYVQYIKIFL